VHAVQSIGVADGLLQTTVGLGAGGGGAGGGTVIVEPWIGSPPRPPTGNVLVRDPVLPTAERVLRSADVMGAELAVEPLLLPLLSPPGVLVVLFSSGELIV
jgi:hypothetical protein